jgi:hypothetical protein
MNGCRRQGMRAAPSIYPKMKAHAESFLRLLHSRMLGILDDVARAAPEWIKLLVIQQEIPSVNNSF